MRNIVLGAVLVGLMPACLILSPLDEATPDTDYGGKGGGGGTTGKGGTGSAGKGGSSTTGGSSSGGSGGAPVPPHTCSDPLMIDDMEDPSHTTNYCQSDRNGGWYVYADGTGTTNPPASVDGGPPFPYSPLDTPRAGSTYAAHVSGSGQTVYGGGMGVSMHFPSAPYDALVYAGIRFWAKGTGSMRVHVSTMQTQDVAFGGDCVPGALDCGDHYQKVIALSSSWQEYTVKFGELTQQGWGVPAISLFIDEILAFEFAWSNGAVFDYWIDDLRFLAADCDDTTFTTSCPTTTSYQTCWYNSLTTFNCSEYCPMIGFTGADTCSAGSCDCPTALRPDCATGAIFVCDCAALTTTPCVEGELPYLYRACFKDAPGFEYVSCAADYAVDPAEPVACNEALTACAP
jgi:hypothetical protein